MGDVLSALLVFLGTTVFMFRPRGFAAVNAAIKRPDIVTLWTKQGAVPMSMTPDEFDKFLRGDVVKLAEVVKKFDNPQ